MLGDVLGGQNHSDTTADRPVDGSPCFVGEHVAEAGELEEP